MADSRQPIDEGRFPTLLDRCAPTRVLQFLLRPRSRWVICWLIALVSLAFAVEQAWICFHEPHRADGNWGHASIDFGGQWLMGRMIVEGHGRTLYYRSIIRQVAQEHYPAADCDPEAKRNDVESLLGWMAGSDDEDPPIGGALYPPVHALVYAPLATLPPRIAYRVLQALILAVLFFDGWLVQRLTGGRIWCPVAFVFLLLFPGCFGAINLGQNAVFSLTLLLMGWWQLARGRPAWAGVCWGLLAFKPVWAASFFLVPLLTRRWRMAMSMALTGLVQIVLTLPVVGWQNWLHWLHIGRLASLDYMIQENWIFLSRDLLSIPRRWMLDFQGGLAEEQEREQWLCSLLGWSLWAAVLAGTLLVVWLRRRRVQVLAGPPAAFVLLGAFLSCYHFMYYDTLLAALPVLLLFTEPRRYLQVEFWRRPRWLARLTRRSAEPDPAPLSPEAWRYYQPRMDDLKPPPLPLFPDDRRPRWVRAPVPPLVCFLILILPGVGYLYDKSNHFPPGDTFGLLFLWAWCGYRLLRDEADVVKEQTPSSASVAVENGVVTTQLAQFDGDIGRTHEGLADQHRADAGRL